MSVRVDVKRNILEWAILRAGYEIQEFLMQYPRVEEWISQTKKPTIKQLEKFSNAVHVPFGYMLLENPPEEKLDFPFFRTGKEENENVSLNVYDTVQIVKRRQDWLSEYLESEGFEQLDFVGKFNENSNFKEIVLDIRKTLKLDKNWATQYNTWEMALENLSIQIEKIGVVINFSGIVGNNTRRTIDVEECRGFVLVDKYAPLMFINSADAKAAQMFTLIHELAHIWIGHSAGFDNDRLLPADDPIELLCDQVAAEFLVPEDFLSEIWKQEQNFRKINRVFKVSPIVVARRAMDLKLIGRNEFFAFYNEYISEFNHKRQNQGSGGNFYATTKKRISLNLVGHINNALNENKLLYKDAFKLTGMKGTTYAKFVKEYLYKA